MPTHREREMRQDPARLKNLLRIAEEKLIEKGMRPTLARDLLEPGRALVDDYEFWTRNQHGLAIYLSNGFSRRFRLPLDVEETALVNDRFDIKPLLPLLNDHAFYVLAVSLNDRRLLECTRHHCERVELPADVPTCIEKAILPGDGHESQTVRYSGNSSNPSTIAGGFHGQTPDNQHKVLEDQLFYFRQIDSGVRQVMKDPNAPIVLAGVDSIVPYYRQAAACRNIASEAWIHGNPDRVTDAELHHKGLEILEPIWRKELSELQEQYGTAHAHSLASSNIYQIVPAAAQGRVGILFVAPQICHPGKFDSDSMMVDDESAEEDLIDAAAVKTLMTGGQVVVVKPGEVPGNSEIAAIYRYMA